MEFRPCIDVYKGKVIQVVGSTLTDKTVKINFTARNDAAYFAKLYKKDGLINGHVIMLDKQKQTQREALKALKAFPKGLCVGGGITINNAKGFLNAGARRVIISSYIFTDKNLNQKRLQKLANTIGKENLIFDLSCKKIGKTHFVAINRWQTLTNLKITVPNLSMLSKYCDEFLIHSIDREGKRQGIDKSLLKILKNFNIIPITYAGGIKNMADIEKIKNIGDEKINFTVGSALNIFGGNLEYKNLIC